jgi:CubicO group peptidase (beta-lactamase class C family)/surface polysaccharide O-acyltransferase-like enzyme
MTRATATAGPRTSDGDAAVTPPTPGSEREVFLDAVRVLALLRVVLWHALGAAFLTYFVAAVPTMFFVTGSLLAKSMRRGAWPVIVDRARRILVPLWVFAFGAYLAMAMSHVLDRTSRTAVPWRDVPFWLFPIDDPVGSPWEGGYMSAPLWYLRALLWLILLSPILLWLTRRTRGRAIALPIAGIFLLEWLARRGSFNGTWAWRVGDLALYATFLMLGFVHRLGELDRLTKRRWAGLGAIAAVAATAWCISQPVPDHVVNDSHPAHLLVGLSWLCAFFVLRPSIERASATKPGQALIGGLSQRTITVYLWHSTAVIISFEVLTWASVPFLPGGWTTTLLFLTAGVTTVFVLAFGWVEDVANRRSPRMWPRTSSWTRPPSAVPRAAVMVAVVGALVLLGAANRSVFQGRRAEAASQPVGPTLRVPSQAPKSPVISSSNTATTVRPGRVPDPATFVALVDAVNAWMAANRVSGVEVSIDMPDVVDWSYATGTDPDTGSAVTVDTRFDIESITKTFTAALVWKAVDDGLIDIDAPIGELTAVPEMTDGQLTPRELLRHTTGLVNYRDTPEYLANPDAVDSPRKALAASSRQPLKFEPGTRSDYSSSNYLVLGFLLEQVTGRNLDALLDEIVQEAGLGTVFHSPYEGGLPNFSAAGLVTTASQLAHWGVALLRDNAPGLSDESSAAMRDIDVTSGLGAGLIGYCPCTVDDEGTLHWAAFGHSGGYTELQYAPDDDIAIVVNVTDSIYVPDGRYDAVQDLVLQLRSIAVAGG